MQQPPTSSSPSNEAPSVREPPHREAAAQGGPEKRAEEPRETLREAAQWIGHQLERPGVGAAAAGGALLAAAVLAGLPEALVGAGGAYVVYRILRKRGRARG